MNYSITKFLMLLCIVYTASTIPLRAEEPQYPSKYADMPYQDTVILGKQHRLYWTFDDHPTDYTDKLLSILRSNGIRGTFFIYTYTLYLYYQNQAYKPTQRRYASVQKILQDKHVIGNHSMTHRFLCKLSPRLIRWEVMEAQKILNKATGLTPKLWRSPHGDMCKDLYAEVTKAGLTSVMWDVGDYRQSVGTIWFGLKRRVGRNYNHTVLLFHNDVQKLEQFLQVLKQNTATNQP